MRREPVVTIGLPVYNGERYLEQAIASILGQTFEDFKLVISDNASEDGTEAIGRAAAARDSRVEYHRQGRNLGAPANYNFTAEQAEGKYFMWQAHDDLRGPAFLERAVEAMESDDSVSVVFSRAMTIDSDGVEIGPVTRGDLLVSPAPHERLRGVILGNPALILFGLTRRAMFERTGRHGAFLGADRVFAAEMAVQGRFVELEDVLFFNRDHADRYVRMSRTNMAAKLEWWDPSAVTLGHPRWRSMRRYLAAVADSPLPPVSKARCVVAVVESLFGNRGYLFKQLVRELVPQPRTGAG